MGNFREFFTPRRMGFHLLLALGITLLLCCLAVLFLRIYTRHGNEVKMPNFIGQDAEILLQNNLSEDFILVVADQVFDKSVAPGTILKQNPDSQELVKKGRKVYLTVASAVPPKVLMPELKDVSQRQAELMLKAKGLELGGIILKPSPFENAVIEQLYKGRAIAAGTEISMGEEIFLVVGKDVEELPDNTDSTQTNSSVQLGI